MADRPSNKTRPTHEHAESGNKYAQVIQQASAKKRTRQDLEDDSWIRNRPGTTPPPVFND